MRYPSEWEVQELEGYIIFRPVELGASLILELRPVDLPSLITESKEGLQLALAKSKDRVTQKYSNDKTSGFRLLESNMTTIDGNLASKLVYLEKSAVEPEKVLKLMELVSVKGDWKYTDILSAYVEEYDR
jgi:hypothetical protein